MLFLVFLLIIALTAEIFSSPFLSTSPGRLDQHSAHPGPTSVQVILHPRRRAEFRVRLLPRARGRCSTFSNPHLLIHEPSFCSFFEQSMSPSQCVKQWCDGV